MFHVRYAFLLSVFVAGCSVHPLQEDVTRKSTTDIVRAIRCEAAFAVHKVDRYGNFDAAIAYDFNLDVFEDNFASPQGTFTNPFLNPKSSFALNFTSASSALTPAAPFTAPGATLSRQAQRRFTIVDHFHDLYKLDPRTCTKVVDGENLLYPISGKIGLGEVIETFVKLKDQLAANDDPGLDKDAPTKVDSATTEFSDDLTFTTRLSTGAINPVLILAPVTNAFRLTQLSGNFGADRVDIHQVIVALALIKASGGSNASKRSIAQPKNQARIVTMLGTSAPTKVALATETNAKTKALQILERRRAYGQNDQLIRAISSLRPQ